MKRDELRKKIVGPMATVATPLDKEYKVDYGRMHYLTNWWIDNGLKTGNSVIKVAAAMGEGPQLRDSEWPHLLRTAVQAAKGRVPIMCGIHYKDTIRAIEDIKLASDLGAVAVQLSSPIHNGPTEDDNLRFYEDVSKAIDIGILIYNTHAMAGGAISVDGFRRMVDFENVVAIKWSPPPADRPIPGKYEEIFELTHTFNIIDNCFGPVKCFKLGGHGYINHTVDIYPQHDIKLLELLRNEKYEEAEALWESVEGPIGIFSAKVGARSGGQARVKKGMMEVMGNPCGVSRPPSEPLLQSEIDELREILRGFGWPVTN